MNEIGCTVERVDNPAIVVLRAVNVGFFLSQDRMIGKVAPNHVDDLPFAFSVYRSHQVNGALVINSLRLLPVFTNDGTCGVGRFPGHTHKISGISVDRHE
jgi:hypothetical protein